MNNNLLIYSNIDKHFSIISNIEYIEYIDI